MATRLYFSESAVAPVTPPAAGAEWEHTSGIVRRLLTAADSSALVSEAYTPDAADHAVNQDALYRRYVSTALAAQTLSGTLTGQWQCLENSAANNLFLTVKVSVISQDGSTTRAVLLAITRAATEVATTLTNRTFPSTALSAYTCVAGDKLLVEVGLAGLPGSGGGVQGHNGAIRWGGNATSGDLPVDQATTDTTYRPWIEFSGAVAFSSTVTKTVKPSGGDYTSLSAWEAGEQGDLVAVGEIRQAECYAMADTTPCTIDGSVTDDTHYMRVYAPLSERHDGTYRTDKYRIEVSDVSGLILADHATRIEGIQVKMTLATNAVHHKAAVMPCYNFSLGASQVQRISQCVVVVDTTGRTDNSNIQGVGLELGATAASPRPRVYLWNCTVYRVGGGAGYNDHTGINGGISDVDLIAYNCTSVDFDYGVRVRSTSAGMVAKNDLARGATIGFYASAGSFDAASDYNRCSDANSVPGANSQNSVTVAFVDYAGNDYHLAGSDTVAKDAGTNLSADSLLAFSDDIDGQTRTGTWDIGADEYVASGGQTATPGTATLSLTALAPTVTASNHQTVVPGVAALNLTPLVPTVTATSGVTVVPGVTALTLTALAPIVTTTAHQTVMPGVASLSLTALTPVVTASGGQTATPGTVALSLAAFAASVTTTNHQTAVPGTASLTLTAFAPSVTASNHQIIVPGSSALNLTPLLPTVTATSGVTVVPGVTALTLMVLAPIVTMTAHQTVVPGVASLSLMSFPPTVQSGQDLRQVVFVRLRVAGTPHRALTVAPQRPVRAQI